MTITEVKIRRLYNQERLKALVSVTFDDAFGLQPHGCGYD